MSRRRYGPRTRRVRGALITLPMYRCDQDRGRRTQRAHGSVIRYEYADAGDMDARLAPFVRLRGRTRFRHRLAQTGRTSSPRGRPTSWLDGLESGCDRWRQPDRSAGAGGWPAPPPSTGRPLADSTSLILTANCDTVCFGHGDHLMVFDVWDTIEEFDAFTATLMPDPRHRTHRPGPAGAARDPRPHRRRRSRALRRRIAELRDKAFFIRPVEKLRE